MTQRAPGSGRPGEPAEPPQSFGDLSDVQQRVVRFLADRDADGWPSGGMDALRRWKVPTGRSDLRAYAGSAQAPDLFGA